MWETILLDFGKYGYIHERYFNLFKKDTNILINTLTVDINNIGRIHIVVIVYHCRGTFCFPMKLIYVIHDKEIIERESYVEYMPCKNVNGGVL